MALIAACVLALTGCSGSPSPATLGNAGNSGSPTASGTATPPTPKPAVQQPPGAETGDTGSPARTPGKVILGSYLDIKGKSLQSSLALRKQQLGRDPRLLQWYYQWTDNLPNSFPDLPAGALPMITWRGTYYSDILNGSQDALITRDAKRVAQYGKPVFLRWAWEMNGSWYLWGGVHNGNSPANFVKAWRHIHDIFIANGATNVGWVWGPNWNSFPVEPWNTVDAYYPGDAYVDWVGLSGYGNNGLTPDDIYDTFYNTYASRKPMMLAETGVVDHGGTTKPDWINLLQQWAVSHPNLGAICWYDTDESPGKTENYRIDSTDGSLAAYKQMSDDPYFSG